NRSSELQKQGSLQANCDARLPPNTLPKYPLRSELDQKGHAPWTSPIGRKNAKIWRTPSALSKRRATSCGCAMAGSRGSRRRQIAFPKFCLAEDPDGLWVAEHGGTIVGFGFSWMTETFWFLSQLFVRPEIQAKGIGQA